MNQLDSPSSVHDTNAEVAVKIELRMPRQDAGHFVDVMTGDDNDVLLAAETAMRNRIDSVGLELSFDDSESDVKGYLAAEAHAEYRSQLLYGLPS